LNTLFQNPILAELRPLEHVVAAPLMEFSMGAWHIVVSNHMLMVTVAMALLLVALPLTFRSRRLIPSGFQNAIESVCEYLRDDMARPILHENTDKYIGFLWTLFFFVLTMNLLGLVPSDKILYLITGKPNHLGGSATANIWVTGALALITFLTTHVCGIRQQGTVKLKNKYPTV